MPPAAVTRRDVASRTARDRGHVRPLHQAFAVDVRVEELAGERFERAGGVRRRDVERGAPAVDDDLAAAAVDGRDEPVARDSVSDAARQVQVDRPALEERRREDDARGAELDELPGALGGADAAADAAGQPGTDRGDEGFVRAGVLGRVEIDQLHPADSR